jgi:hypothetical protein
LNLKRFLPTFLLAFSVFNLSNVTFAEEQIANKEVTTNEVKEYSAEGEYRLGDDDTRASAKIKALDDAKRKIAEQVGVYVESISELNKYNLSKDIIRTVATAMIKIKSEDVKFSENGTLCRVVIVADADTDNKYIAEIIKKILAEENDE